jgi:hypothetical protein
VSSVLKLADTQPDQELISVLEVLLAKAKTGEVVSVCYAAELKDRAVQTGFTRSPNNAFTMLGAIERLKLRYYSVFVEE